MDSFMMEARIPTRKWAGYDLATVVARDDKKVIRGNAEHIEKEMEGDEEIARPARPRRFPSLANALQSRSPSTSKVSTVGE
jgi:hypothetical protein